MKKIIYILILSMVVNKTYTQGLLICGEIDYVQSTHFSRDFSKDFILKFSNNHSIYKEVNLTKEEEKIKQADKDEGLQISIDVPRNNLNPEFFYNDRENFYFMEVWYDNELLVKEVGLAWQWDLKDEVKKIGKFNCQKASSTFRGREYTAWFTEEIPVPYGPWKFQGLSGLILEIYDKDRVFHIVAKNVRIDKQRDCEIKVDRSKFNSAITIEQYLKKKDELIKEDFARLSSRLPKGHDPFVIDEDCDDCKEEVEIFKDE